MTKCLLTIFYLTFLTLSVSQAQSNLLNLAGSYGRLYPKGKIIKPVNTYGFAAAYERALSGHLSLGLEAGWQWIEPYEGLYATTPFGPFTTFEFEQQIFTAHVGSNWYFGQSLRGLYVGLFGSYDYITNTTDGLPETHPLYDPIDDFGGGLGLRYGFRLSLTAHLRLSAQGNHEIMWLDGSNRSTFYLHHWDLGVGWVF